MKKTSKIAFAIMFLGLIGCSSNNDDSSSSNCESSIPFLQAGKIFTYNVVQFGIDTGTMKMTYGACNGNGFPVLRETFSPAGEAVSSGTDLVKQEGDFMLSDSYSNGDYFSKLYKKNAVLGDTWSVLKPDGSTVMHEVVDMDSIVTVPAGTFHCKVFKYNTTSTINDSYVFWDEQIGEIKEDAGFLTLELKSHN